MKVKHWTWNLPRQNQQRLVITPALGHALVEQGQHARGKYNFALSILLPDSDVGVVHVLHHIAQVLLQNSFTKLVTKPFDRLVRRLLEISDLLRDGGGACVSASLR